VSKWFDAFAWQSIFVVVGLLAPLSLDDLASNCWRDYRNMCLESTDNKKNKQQSTTYITNSRTGPHATVQVGGVVEHVGCKSKVRLHLLFFASFWWIA
jgi:hypothetical protein